MTNRCLLAGASAEVRSYWEPVESIIEQLSIRRWNQSYVGVKKKSKTYAVAQLISSCAPTGAVVARTEQSG